MRLEGRLKRRIAILDLCCIIAVVVVGSSVGDWGSRVRCASGGCSIEKGKLANWGGIGTSGQASVHVGGLICFIVNIPFGIGDVGKYLQNRQV